MLLPALFVAVIMVDQRGNSSLWVALNQDADHRGSVGVEEDGGRFGGQLVDFTKMIFFKELLALAEDGDGRMSVDIAILAYEAIELRGGKFDGGGMQRNDQPLRERGRLRAGARLERSVVREKPAGQFGLVEGAGP